MRSATAMLECEKDFPDLSDGLLCKATASVSMLQKVLDGMVCYMAVVSRSSSNQCGLVGSRTQGLLQLSLQAAGYNACSTLPLQSLL